MEQKRNNPFIAGILSLLAPGLGQIYNGQLRKGFILYVGYFIFVYFLLPLTSLQYTFPGLMLLICLMFVFILVIGIDAIIYAVRNKEKTLRVTKLWYFYVMLVVSLVFQFDSYDIYMINSYWDVQPYIIRNDGMEPTLQNNDYIVTNNKYYKINNPHRNDLIVFKEKSNVIVFIKRCVGLPGDTVMVKDSTLYINGKPIKEDLTVMYNGKLKENYGPTVVPLNKYFMLGDNRNKSTDSRESGFVDRSKLLGKCLYIYWSDNKKRIGKSF